jgi:hypothetical protein
MTQRPSRKRDGRHALPGTADLQADASVIPASCDAALAHLEAELRLEAAAGLLSAALVLGDIELEAAATGALGLIDRARLFLRVMA